MRDSPVHRRDPRRGCRRRNRRPAPDLAEYLCRHELHVGLSEAPDRRDHRHVGSRFRRRGHSQRRRRGGGEGVDSGCRGACRGVRAPDEPARTRQREVFLFRRRRGLPGEDAAEHLLQGGRVSAPGDARRREARGTRRVPVEGHRRFHDEAPVPGNCRELDQDAPRGERAPVSRDGAGSGDTAGARRRPGHDPGHDRVLPAIHGVGARQAIHREARRRLGGARGAGEVPKTAPSRRRARKAREVRRGGRSAATLHRWVIGHNGVYRPLEETGVAFLAGGDATTIGTT